MAASRNIYIKPEINSITLIVEWSIAEGSLRTGPNIPEVEDFTEDETGPITGFEDI